MFDSPISKTQEELVQAARAATTDYITNGTNLTDAVVKAASAITPLTSEHVRRICEMTYHDAYERMFAEKTGMLQYVSFDPPDAIRASELLDALQLGLNNQANFDKLASDPIRSLGNMGTAFGAVAGGLTGYGVGHASDLDTRGKVYTTAGGALAGSIPGRHIGKYIGSTIGPHVADTLSGLRGTEAQKKYYQAKEYGPAGILIGGGLAGIPGGMLGKKLSGPPDTEKNAGILSNYLDVMRGKNVDRGRQVLSNATEQLAAHNKRVARNKDILGTVQKNINTLQNERKAFFGKNNIPTKQQKGYKGITDPVDRLAYSATDRATLDEADRLFNPKIEKDLADAQREIKRRVRADRKANVVGEARTRRVNEAAANVSAEQGKTNTYRVLTGTAVAVPTGILGVKAMKNNQEKRASAPSMPRKFQRMNTHEIWTKAASGTELPDHNPTRELQQVHRDLKDSISLVKSDLYSAEQNEKLAMIDMVKQAKAGLSAGHSMEQVLYAALSVVDATEPFMAKTAHDLCATIIEACADHQNSGFRKEASALQEVNPNHPIPQMFKKLAEANIQRKHLEVTLDELNRNMDYFNEKIKDEFTR